jgi:hypothetical protein
MRALVTAVYLALSAPALSVGRFGLGRAQIVLVAKLRAVRQRVRRARFRWER